MKKTLLLFLCSISCIVSFAQRQAEAEKLVQEGIGYHDKGDYAGAIAKYDKALALDKDNLLALAEKGLTLYILEKYEAAIECCEKALEVHPGKSTLKTVYITYGNSLDVLKRTDKSIEAYDAGIKQFPDFFLFYFNKGVTLSSVKQYDEAILCFQKAVMLNPKHPGSHNAMARLLDTKHKNIPSLFAYGRFLVLEPQEKRGAENLARMQAIMKSNVEQTGDNSVTITIDSGMLGDTTETGAIKENNFSVIDLLLGLTGAMDFEKKYKKEKPVARFIRKFELECSTLDLKKEDHFGIYWEYYAPYFAELHDKHFVETFAYIAFSSSNDKAVTKWLKGHKEEIGAFYKWSESFAWKKT